MFVPLNFFKTEVTGAMSPTDVVLNIPQPEADKICAALGDECIPCSGMIGGLDFTRLVISYSGYNEVVRVTGCAGGVVTVVRGDEGTIPMTVPVGACVSFQWTAANLECAIIQVASGFSLSGFANCGKIDLGAGVPGPQGDPGPTGPIGPQGLDGPAGTVGPAGSAGPTGAGGAPGANGLNGLDGAQGSQGSPGAAGAQGADGPTGPPGADGAVGIQGPQGVAGTNGTNGKSAYENYVEGGGTQSEAQFSTCLATTCP